MIDPICGINVEPVAQREATSITDKPIISAANTVWRNSKKTLKNF
jgi:hypothetical protein